LASEGREVKTFDDLAGLGKTRPAASALLSVGVLSLMGFPPTAGFFAKYYVFRSAVAAGGWFLPLAVFGVLLSILGAYYYLKIIVSLYMREAPDSTQESPAIAGSTPLAVAVWFTALCALALGVMPDTLTRWALLAAQSLTGN
jgi:NADH-quinone oxidoreductase subunit N